LAPEAKFPGGFYDSVQSFLYLIDKNGEYGFDPKNIMIMGDSAGGGLCLALMLYLRNHGLPLPEGGVLLSVSQSTITIGDSFFFVFFITNCINIALG
jgi:acetyl esterase/lipase